MLWVYELPSAWLLRLPLAAARGAASFRRSAACHRAQSSLAAAASGPLPQRPRLRVRTRSAARTGWVRTGRGSVCADHIVWMPSAEIVGGAARVIAGCAGCVLVGSAALGLSASASGMVQIAAPRWRSSCLDCEKEHATMPMKAECSMNGVRVSVPRVRGDFIGPLAANIGVSMRSKI